MSALARLIEMLEQTAEALGPTLRERSAFVGGCVVGLLVTDDFAREQVRATDDVDLIVNLSNYAAYEKLAKELRVLGFKESAQDDVLCRWRLGKLVVDVMPTDAKILGFTNRWYARAIDSASKYALPSGLRIHIVSPPYFVGTKIEAFYGRGNNDYLTSKDIEDIITLVDGREELEAEIKEIGGALEEYIQNAFLVFLAEKNFSYAIESATRNDRERVNIILKRFHAIATLKPPRC